MMVITQGVSHFPLPELQWGHFIVTQQRWYTRPGYDTLYLPGMSPREPRISSNSLNAELLRAIAPCNDKRR